jgi:NitT/TauT family transport system substrate-binding protein
MAWYSFVALPGATLHYNEYKFVMMSKRLLGLFFLAALLALGLPACKREEGPPALRLGYFANLSHAQAVLGVSSGELPKALGAAKLDSTVFNAGPSLIEAIFAGQIDVGYVGPGPAISAHGKSKGRAIRVIAGAAANGVVIVTRKGSGITKLSDLAGKKIASPQLGNTQDLSARHYVTTALGQKNADTVVPIANAEQGAMLARGEVDAAWVPEPWGESLIRSGAELLAEEKDLWPGKRFTLAVVVTTPEYLAAHGDLVKKLLDVHVSWTRRLAADPGAHVAALGDALAKLTQKRLPEGVLATAMKRVTFTDSLDDDTFPSYARWSHELGFERAPVDVAGLLDQKLIGEARASAR